MIPPLPSAPCGAAPARRFLRTALAAGAALASIARGPLLRTTHADWATLALRMVKQREGLHSLRLLLHSIPGTPVLGVTGFSAFVVLIIDLRRRPFDKPTAELTARLYDGSILVVLAWLVTALAACAPVALKAACCDPPRLPPQSTPLRMSGTAWPPLPLPAGVHSRRVPDVNGLDLHVLEAGDPAAPCLLLLHGFPELAFSWRHQLQPLAEAGYHVLAPDQRGYGRSTGWPADYDADLRPFGMLNLARDALGLVAATGHREVAAVIGHDFGSLVAAWCALLRPDVFRRLVMMSAPFGGPPPLPGWGGPAGPADLAATLAALPRPRKHYQLHYGTREANAEMRHGPQGLHAFLRAYYHVKSADWPGNTPHPLPDWRAETLAQMPTYYIMDRDRGMAETVIEHLPTPAQVAACRWLPDDDLAVYAAEYARTGFQGGLQWYRCSGHPPCVAEQQLFAGRRIEVPAAYIAGAADWGMFQKPGELQRMQHEVCSRFVGLQVLPGAGHWVQQEQPQAVTRLLLDFLAETGA